MAFEVYCDESGTTGPNFFDPASPIFVYSMLAVDEAVAGYLRETGAERVKDARLQDVAELKYSRLSRHGRGQRLVAAIGELLDSKEARLCYVVVEKRFQVCALIVETFLDPKYNPTAPLEDAGPLRREFANIIYDTVSDAVLSDCLLSRICG